MGCCLHEAYRRRRRASPRWLGGRSPSPSLGPIPDRATTKNRFRVFLPTIYGDERSLLHGMAGGSCSIGHRRSVYAQLGIGGRSMLNWAYSVERRAPLVVLDPLPIEEFPQLEQPRMGDEQNGLSDVLH